VIAQLESVSVRRSQQDSDDLVPLHQPFETSLRGFNRRQVLEHLESLDGRIAMVVADRDAALAQVADLSKVLNHLRSESELLEHLRREADKAASQVERLLESPMAEANARIQRIMRLAEEEAAELKANAEKEITAQRALAEHEITELRSRVDQEITRLRARASSETESLFEHTKRHCDQLEAASLRRQELAEQDAAQAIAQRDSEATDRIRGSEMRSIVRVCLMLRAVDEQLTTRLGAVEREETALRELRAQAAEEATALEALRTEVTAALATTHQLVTEAIGQVQQTMTEGSDDAVQVPLQRSTEGGRIYLLNAANEERRSTHPSS
jgi:cell division septum initiation protein DivIVA